MAADNDSLNRDFKVGCEPNPTLASRASCGRLLRGLLSDLLPMDTSRPDTLPVLMPSEFTVLDSESKQQVVKIHLKLHTSHLPARLVLKRIPSFNNFLKLKRMMDLASQSCRLSCAHINSVVALTLSPEFGIISELRIASCASLLSSSQRKDDFTVTHLISMLRQCLSALIYLLRQPCEDIRHHNNIKLSNILVEFFDGLAIHIRLCDLAVCQSQSVSKDLIDLHRCLYNVLLCSESHGSLLDCKHCSLLLPPIKNLKAKAVTPLGSDEARLLQLLDAMNSLDVPVESLSHAVLPAGSQLQQTQPESDTQCLGMSDIPQRLRLNPSDLQLTNQILGSGYYGTVERGLLLYNGSRISVAVKTVKPGVPHQRFIKEVLTQEKLPQNCNILQLLKVEEGERQLITPYMETALDMYLRNHRSELCGPRARTLEPNGEPLALNFLRQIACGMEFLSNHGVFHCDLAGRNVLMEKLKTKQPRLKIGDFGLSGMFHDTADGDTPGTYKLASESKDGRYMPIYILPPTDLLAGSIQKTTDSWSFGTLIWEMFNSVTVQEAVVSVVSPVNWSTLSKFVTERPQKYLLSVSSLPPCLAKLAKECWEPDYKARITLQEIRRSLYEDVKTLQMEANGTGSGSDAHC